MNPQESKDPDVRALDALEDLRLFVHLCWQGLGYAKVATEVMEVLKEARERRAARGPGSVEIPEEERRHAARLEEFAKVQLPAGFPYLYSLASIRVWAILESFAADMVLFAIHQYPDVRSLPALRTLSGPLVEFTEASETEQAEIILQLLLTSVSARLRKGVGRFEAVFNNIGMGGPVADPVRKALLELSEVRNVLIHRDGRADRQFVQACPWFGAVAGEPIRLTWPKFDRYVMASHWYLIEISRRQVEKYPALAPEGTATPARHRKTQMVLEERLNRPVTDEASPDE